jgi:hypothetical protein
MRNKKFLNALLGAVLAAVFLFVAALVVPQGLLYAPRLAQMP